MGNNTLVLDIGCGKYRQGGKHQADCAYLFSKEDN